MYFAHHSGTFIRLAYADDLQGPWRINEPGTLQLKDAPAFHDHIASPDVHVDDETQLIRMYFHGPAKAKSGQWTGVATSKDGIQFSARSELLGKFYFRVWKWREYWYALAKNNNEGWGELYRAAHHMGLFESRGNFLRGMRHCAVLVQGHTLLIFFSRVGDAPERVLMATVDMRDDWLRWEPIETVNVLRPELDYEGGRFSVTASTHGAAINVREVRDPFVIEESDDVMLFYTGAGEANICGARIKLDYTQEVLIRKQNY